MSKWIAIVVFSVVFAARVIAQPAAPEGMVWKEVAALSDEFTSWNSGKWTKSLWNYGVPVQMVSRNSGVRGGKLWIKASLNDGAERWFESCRVMSRAKISYPMYTECSMKTAHISAYNTYWMNNGNSANRDEIDICENNSKASIVSQREERKYTMYSQYFVVKDNDTERNKGNFDNRNLSADNPLKGVAWNEDYHTLGVWWKDANNIQFYLDGEPAGKVKSTRDFTLSLNIIWDLWTIDANWSGGIAEKTDLLDNDINTMYVDWVHTYSLEEDPNLGVADANISKNITLYPNPANNQLNVQIGNFTNTVSLHVFDVMGKVVLTQNLTQKESQVSLNSLNPGLYFASVRGEGVNQTKSFVKE